jgi:hypothetical protein
LFYISNFRFNLGQWTQIYPQLIHSVGATSGVRQQPRKTADECWILALAVERVHVAMAVISFPA